MARPTEDTFLGTLLGMAIGDAMGMPLAGLNRDEIRQRFGTVDGYHAKTLADGAVVKAGEFTDESEIALCIVESLTVGAGGGGTNGAVDVETLAPRLIHLARGESRRWMAPDTLAALLRADETLEYRAPLDEDAPATGEVAARGVPIGLAHALGAFDPAAFRDDVEAVVRITHGSPAAVAAATAVGYATRLAARAEVPPEQWAAETAAFLGVGELAERLSKPDHRPEELAASASASNVSLRDMSGEVAPDAVAVVPAAIACAASAVRFEDAVSRAVNLGGATDTLGALSGALAGARFGSSGIPQALIDGLEGRIYVSLAAPWFFRAVRRRAGLLIDLKPAPQPRPSTPPRF